MNKLTFILLFIFFSSILNAQPYETNPDFNRTRNWHFGYGVGLHFSPDTVYNVPTSIYTDEAAAVHTDAEGNLLLYSNGQSIWNSDNDVIHNGNLSLGHHSSNLGSIFIFHEDNPESIYLINTNYSASNNNQLSFNLIIKENDNFKVVIKDSIIQTNMSEPIAIIKSDNSRDLWIVSHVYNGSQFVTYRLTKEGIVACPTISNAISQTGSGFQGAQFDIVFSIDGKYLLKSNTSIIPITNNDVELYEFDSKSGQFKFMYFLDSLKFPVLGINFSKNNKNIFVSERDNNLVVFKFNPLDNNTTLNSRKKISIPQTKFKLQHLTYMNDIAVSIADSSYLLLIKNSNEFDSIDIVLNGIYMGNGKAFNSIPNFNQSYFHTPSIDFAYEINCIVNNIQFYGRDTIQASNHEWLITRQGVSPITNNTKTPLIEFEDTGTYLVRYITSNGNRSDTITKEVAILPKIDKSFLGNDTGWCDTIDTSIIINAPSDMHCYEWNTGESTPAITVETSGIYIAKITTPNFCVLYDTISITLDSVPSKPFIYQAKDTLRTNTEAKFYQWYKGNQPIGENQPYLKLIDTGVYQLKTTTNGGCITESDTFHVYRVGIKNINFDSIKVFPNPFNNHLYINDFNYSIVKIEIHSIEGKVLKDIIPKNTETIIKTNDWAEGIYIIRLQLTNNETRNYKIIKSSR